MAARFAKPTKEEKTKYGVKILNSKFTKNEEMFQVIINLKQTLKHLYKLTPVFFHELKHDG